MSDSNFIHGRLIGHSAGNNHRLCGNSHPSKGCLTDDCTGDEEFDPFEGDEVDDRCDMASFAPPESK